MTATPFFSATLRDAPRYLQQRAPQQLEARARAWLSCQLERCHDPLFGQNFARHCPIPGRSPREYQQRILDLPSGGQILVGIRFRGQQMDFPFVDLLASSRPWLEQRDEVLQRVRQDYEAFSPRALRVATDMQADEMGLGQRIDQGFYAADLSEIRLASPRAAPDFEVRIAGLTDIEHCLELSSEAYAQFRADEPQLAAQVVPSTREQLLECVQSGLLAIIVNRSFQPAREAGILAVAQAAEWLFEGLCVYEEVLLREQRGLGLARHAQRRLADELLARGQHGLLWGTIDGSNHASARTASSAGRLPRAAWYFVDLAQKGPNSHGSHSYERAPKIPDAR